VLPVKTDVPPVRFKDAIGRKYSFPYHIFQTWAVSSSMSVEALTLWANVYIGRRGNDQGSLPQRSYSRATCSRRSLRSFRARRRGHTPIGLGACRRARSHHHHAHVVARENPSENVS
jgi:hypothetical protein